MTEAVAGEAFLCAYDAVRSTRWPSGTQGVAVPTPFGTTHVNSHGPADAPAVVLLHGGGGVTSTVWGATASTLGGTYRVHAIDTMGEAGRSIPGDRRITTLDDQLAWLDAVLDGLGAKGPVAICGHSYGAWTAAHYALRAPDRVAALILIEPTHCFTGFSPLYLARALPMLLRPTVRNRRAFLAWETGGAKLDPNWTRLYELATTFPAAKPLTGPRPAPAHWPALRADTLLVLAGRTRT
ncbi:MAG TPA: alpha/beta fold hydrolase, partial [Yinghuangia sp.]|nr:alpha/beta fold hydrolase [Yinghuangia sp.]